MNRRHSGVLLNVSSLPGDFGIGEFSLHAGNFLSFIRQCGFTMWQILPLSSIGTGNSPYSGLSSFAINYLYVDPISLMEDGLITQDDVNSARYSSGPYCTDYAFVKESKRRLLQKALENSQKFKADIDIYYKENKEWLLPYAMFMTVKDITGGNVWWEWSDEYKFYKNINRKRFAFEHQQSIDYYVFEQFILEKQWNKVKDFAHQLGICILGDMPIYASLDSVDVWANSENYQLDKDLRPVKVAGVPPDYFSADGQLWGNPLYDYDYMAGDKYSYLLKKFSRMFELYDGLRIDHFRGFSKYWEVDRDETTARNGRWAPGPEMKLFSIVKRKFADKLIVAEDLGIIDDDTRKFLEETGFPGMRVMQFAFTDEESTHLPHNFPINCVGYTATHDNDTTLGWLYSQNENVREYALNYCDYSGSSWGAGGAECTSNKAFIKTLLSSSARIAIVPMQDLCGYGSDTRMNVPGRAEGNWIYRATYSAFNDVDRQFMLAKNNIYGRNNSFDFLK